MSGIRSQFDFHRVMANADRAGVKYHREIETEGFKDPQRPRELRFSRPGMVGRIPGLGAATQAAGQNSHSPMRSLQSRLQGSGFGGAGKMARFIKWLRPPPEEIGKVENIFRTTRVLLFGATTLSLGVLFCTQLGEYVRNEPFSAHNLEDVEKKFHQ